MMEVRASLHPRLLLRNKLAQLLKGNLRLNP